MQDGIALWIARRETLVRWLLAGPGAAAAALLTMAATPLLLPPGAAGIDHIVFPILLFPAIWAVLFFYACLAENLPRAVALVAGTAAVEAVVIAFRLS